MGLFICFIVANESVREAGQGLSTSLFRWGQRLRGSEELPGFFKFPGEAGARGGNTSGLTLPTSLSPCTMYLISFGIHLPFNPHKNSEASVIFLTSSWDTTTPAGNHGSLPVVSECSDRKCKMVLSQLLRLFMELRKKQPSHYSTSIYLVRLCAGLGTEDTRTWHRISLQNTVERLTNKKHYLLREVPKSPWEKHHREPAPRWPD